MSIVSVTVLVVSFCARIVKSKETTVSGATPAGTVMVIKAEVGSFGRIWIDVGCDHVKPTSHPLGRVDTS